MSFSFTVFKNTFDNKTNSVFHYETWDQFSNMLFVLSKKPGNKGGNNSSPLISPARFRDNTTRSNSNVEYWASWCAVDVDDYNVSGDIRGGLQEIVGSYEFVCYSTASSTPTHPKFRLVFPLTDNVYANKIPHFWHSLNKKLKELGDKQTKDLARIYYVPAQYPDAFNFYFKNSGKIINPSALMEIYPYQEKSSSSFIDRLPEKLKNEVINYRKNQAEQNDIVWTSYHDCPFFPRNLGNEYKTISKTGWYHTMYRIMVAIAGNAIKNNYPITAKEIANMCKQLDNETGKWYDNRPLEKEADRAIEFVYRNN
jgi:hypothetical protein